MYSKFQVTLMEGFLTDNIRFHALPTLKVACSLSHYIIHLGLGRMGRLRCRFIFIYFFKIIPGLNRANRAMPPGWIQRIVSAWLMAVLSLFTL